MDLNKIEADIKLAEEVSPSGWIMDLPTLRSMVDLIKRQEAELHVNAQALADSNLALMEQTEIAQAANRQAEQERHEFKNFHRMLCARFGCQHDDIDWKRDQVSLMEFIAAATPPAIEAPQALSDEQIKQKWRNWVGVIGLSDDVIINHGRALLAASKG